MEWEERGGAGAGETEKNLEGLNTYNVWTVWDEFQTSSSSSFEFEFELTRNFLDVFKSLSVE